MRHLAFIPVVGVGVGPGVAPSEVSEAAPLPTLGVGKNVGKNGTVVGVTRDGSSESSTQERDNTQTYTIHFGNRGGVGEVVDRTGR